MIRILVFLFLTALLAAPCAAAQPYQPVFTDPLDEPWRWRSYPQLDGLGLRCLAETSDGAMWFGTDEGVRRYDGIEWTSYTSTDGLLGRSIISLVAGPGDQLFAGSESGISRYRGGAWEPIFPPTDGPPWPVNDLMITKNGDLWAGTAWGALAQRDQGWTLYTTQDVASALRTIAPEVEVVIVPDEVAPVRGWDRPMGTTNTSPGSIGVQVVEPGWTGLVARGITMPVWAIAVGGPAERAGIRVGDRILAIDGVPNTNGESLGGSIGEATTLTIHRKGRNEPIQLKVDREAVSGGRRDFAVHDIFEADDGLIWLGLHQGEIVSFDPHGSDGRAWRLFTTADGLSLAYSPHIAQTRDGTIWTVSNGAGGVNRFDGDTWSTESLPSEVGLPIMASILVTSDGMLWIGGYGYLHTYREGVWRIYRFDDYPFPFHRPRLFESSNGNLWVAGLGLEAVSLEYRSHRWRSYSDLAFQCQGRNGVLWFLTRDRHIIRHDPRTNDWRRYDAGDGVMERPVSLIATRTGEIWTAGRHRGLAATSRFRPATGRWVVQTHPSLSHDVRNGATYETEDGALWFSGASVPRDDMGQRGGLMEYRPLSDGGGSWTHHMPPSAPMAPYAVSQTTDGRVWFGGMGLRYFDGQNWGIVTRPEPLKNWVHALLGSSDGKLWVGTRLYGAFVYDGVEWTQFTTADGLAGNRINRYVETSDGSIWAATNGGLSRFDGSTWTPNAVHTELLGIPAQTEDGAIWLNIRGGTIRYEIDPSPPDTKITLSIDEVSQPGNTPLAWEASDLWEDTPRERLQYSWRLDGNQWSPFRPEKGKVFLSLASGKHRFEVKARDADLNEDLTPAAVEFRVVAPVWRQPWFIGLSTGAIGIILFLTLRLVRQNAALRKQARELAHEVAERERMEEALLESERIRVLAETAGAAAHEINQPLMVIMGLVQLLQKQQRGAVPPPSDLETIYKQAERIEEIVKKMGAARQYAATDYVGETRIIDFDEASKVEDEEEPPPPG